MRAAIYTRKSKFKEQGEGIETQINMCIDYAKSNLGITDYDVYIDEGFSGKNVNRPQFQEMLKNIQNKKYTHFICYRLDRAFRNVSDYAYYVDLFSKCDTSFVSIKEQFDTTTAMGRAMMNVSATFAQLERETTAERMKDNLYELSKTGRWLGGPAPIGFTSIEVATTDDNGKKRKKHILEIDEHEMDKVKLIFDLFLEYKSYFTVSKELSNRGITTKNGIIFARSVIKQTITNPVYVIADKKIIDFFKDLGCEIYGEDKIDGKRAIMSYNRHKKNGSFNPEKNWLITVGDHPGVLPSDTWLQCYNIRREIEHKISNRQCTSQHALLSGLVVCSKCGSGMAPHKQKRGDTLYRYYICNLKGQNSKKCDNVALNAHDAEEYVVKKLIEITPEEIISNYNKSHSKKIAINRQDIINKKLKEIETNNTSISNLVLKIAKLNDYDLEEIFKQEIKKLKHQNEKIKSEIKQIEVDLDTYDDAETSINEIQSRLNNFKKLYNTIESFEDKKRLIRSVVKFITWDSTTSKIRIVLVGSNEERPKRQYKKTIDDDSTSGSSEGSLRLGNHHICSYIS